MNDLPKFYIRPKKKPSEFDDQQRLLSEGTNDKQDPTVHGNPKAYENNNSECKSLKEGQPKLNDSSNSDSNVPLGFESEGSYYDYVGREGLCNIRSMDHHQHTIVKNSTAFDRNSIFRESMVGLRDGVPGTYSGYDQKTIDRGRKETLKELSTRGSKKPRSVSDSSYSAGHLLDGKDKNTRKQRTVSDVYDSSVPNKEKISPVRPPRKARVKSVASTCSDDDYDMLWDCVNKPVKSVSSKVDGAYSKLDNINDNESLYDEVEEDRSILINKINISPNTILMNTDGNKGSNWIEGGVRVYDPLADASASRPLSTVVLPISEFDDVESDSDSESWGSEFDESLAFQQRYDEGDVYELIGTSASDAPRKKNSDYEELDAFNKCVKKSPQKSDGKKPPLPPRNSFSGLEKNDDADKIYYVDVNLQGMAVPPAILPPLQEGLSSNEVKRYQIVKCILENEKMYMVTLHRLIQDYEKPLKEKKIINQERIKTIFNHLSEIEQCHQLFNIALGGRMDEWNSNPNIGDIIYASFSKSMVLKAYSSFIGNFNCAMDNVKDTCKLVPMFMSFLKTRLHRRNVKETLYDLLKQPLERVPQLTVLLQELLKVTPFPHDDRMSLQMALTQLECLSEVLCEKRRDMEMKHKVQQLDKYFAGINKSLSSRKRYYIRHDDMLLCKISHGQVTKTKLRRLFLLSDLLVCASIMNRSKQVTTMFTKRYNVKWCVPIVDVDVAEVGSGIHVDIDNKTTTIKYTHPISCPSPRPGARATQKHLEDIQHDLAVIGQVAGLVASLRQSYDVINPEIVSEWYRKVKDTLDNETERLNMHWLELSLPARDGKTNCLFYLTPPDKKIEWTAELDNAKLRLAYDNNPGWYVEDDESATAGGVAVLRRNLPLIANKVPLFMVEAKFTIECVLEITPPSSTQPILWIFSGNEHTGQITLMKMSMLSVPYVIESFVACDSRILCAAIVKDELDQFNDSQERKWFVWCGTTSGSVHIFDGSCADEHKLVSTARLRDAVVCIRYVCSKVFTGLANGTLACFRRKMNGEWDLRNPTIVCLGQLSVLTVTETSGRLWCGCGNKIFIIDFNTLGIEHIIEINESAKSSVRHLVSYGVGVWVSMWKSSKLLLYHCETFENLQSINIAMPLSRMKHDVDSRVQNINLEKLHTTALLARDGLLWVGTDAGVILTYPLPRMGGVPQVSLRPSVSFHGHDGPVRCLHAFKVERHVRQKETPAETEKGVARSLFYTDPLAAPSSGFSASIQGKDGVDGTKLFRKIAEMSETDSEPYYFTVVPDEQGTVNPDEQGTVNPSTDVEETDSYKLWLHTFGNPVNRTDPIASGQNNEVINDRERFNSYDSEDSVDSDQEFSFIEDKQEQFQTPSKVKKMAATICSVNMKPKASVRNSPAGVVKSKTLQGVLPPINESDFIKTLHDFQGFEQSEQLPKASTPTNKSDSGYEEPISSIKPVKDPYANVNKPDSGKGCNTVLQAQNDVSNVVDKHYKYAPLPELPDGQSVEKPLTLLQIVNESPIILNSISREGIMQNDQQTEDADKFNEQVEEEDKSQESFHETTEDNCPGSNSTNDTGNKPEEQMVCLHEKATDAAEKMIDSEEKTTKTEEVVPKTIEVHLGVRSTEVREQETAEMTINHNEQLKEQEKDINKVENDIEVDNEVERLVADTAERIPSDTAERIPSDRDRSVRSPIFVKVTDMQTQRSVEGSLEATDTDTICLQKTDDLQTKPDTSNKDMKDGLDPAPKTPLVTYAKEINDSSVGVAGTSNENVDLKRYYSLSKRSQIKSFATDYSKFSHDDSLSKQRCNTYPCKPLDGTPSQPRDIEQDETAYTPLYRDKLKQTLSNTSANSSISGVGTTDYDKDVALSTSLTRQIPEGYYTTLVSVSRNDAETRRQLLLKPMYVISVGPGHVDLRRKIKGGLGVGEFFRNFGASNPDPQLIIWKLTV